MLAIKLTLRASVVAVFAGLTLSAQTPSAPARVSPAAPVARVAPVAPVAPVARVAPAAPVAPASVGISAERLDRLHKGMQGFVDRKEAAGIVTLLAREGKIVDVHAVGFADVDKNVPMKTDAIFRIASMTKPITSVAIMMLYEEGKLLLNDPVSKFIPAFKSSRVLEGTDANATPAASRRSITVRDLLTHRSGITYGFLSGGPVGGGYRKNGITDGLSATPMTLEEGINKLAAEPLVSQPGAAFNYSLSTDVLGRVVEVVSGQPLNVFMRERIFKPLKMVDTDFVVPESKWSRFVTAYSPDGKGSIRAMTDPEAFGNLTMSPFAYYKEGKTYYSGGAGLASTAADYARFGNMLVNGGALDGVRLLSPKTIELMTATHSADLPHPLPLVGAGKEWGLGFQVVTDLGATQTMGSEGMYGWSGIYGTIFWVDPKEKLVSIMMVQRYPGATVAAAFLPLVYQSLVK